MDPAENVITIIDYGIGNLRSIEKAFQSVGAEVIRSDRAADIERARLVVLPGVGAFGACADEIRRRDLVGPILDAVDSGKPFLGVCVGMQLLFEVGEELGRHEGLGILPGRVRRLEADALKIPHMGWNTVVQRRPSPILQDLAPDAYFYFVHSYAAVPERDEDVLATSHYGTDFAAVVQRNNVFGVQFHPEKSQRNGLCILRNFAQLGHAALTS